MRYSPTILLAFMLVVTEPLGIDIHFVLGGRTLASFKKHIEPLIAKEGGYKLTNIKGDRGGRTYAADQRTCKPEVGWMEDH